MQRRRVFQQHREIGTATQHGNNQRQNPLQREVRVRGIEAGLQQLRHESLQPLLPLRLQGQYAAAVPEFSQPCKRLLALPETLRLEQFSVEVVVPGK